MSKTKQDDLRRLMKERRENLTSQKIDSPFAKYDSKGQLSCSICAVPVKGSSWSAHLAGKAHKEALKGKKNDPAKLTQSTDESVSLKRTSMAPPPAKKLKSDVKPNLPQNSNSVTKVPSRQNIKSSNGSEDDSKSNANVPLTSNNTLPSDFFDASVKPNVDATTTKEQQKVAEIPDTALPQGFFDDPVLDAKARHIEYKDPAEEEWERFQKTIAEESNVSKNMIEEELEEIIQERGIAQIDEQILQWERVKNLESLADDVKKKVAPKDSKEQDMDVSDDDLEEDDLLDWRSKSIKR